MKNKAFRTSKYKNITYKGDFKLGFFLQARLEDIMTKKQLLKEKENLEYKLSILNKVLKQDNIENPKYFILDTTPWRNDILWLIADIVRTSPIVNKNYPYGYDCNICEECGNECSTDGDGIDCNWAFVEYFEKELRERGYYESRA